MHTSTPGAPTQPWTSSSSPLPSFQSSMHTFSPCATYQTSMHFSSSPSAPYQTNMHFSSSLSAPYQYSMHNTATPFPPPQSSMHSTATPFPPPQSSPSAHQTPTGSSNPVQSNSNPIAPPNYPIPKLRRKRMVTSETLNASKNASRYMGAIKFARS
nr:merozoite surface protein CMZ-8-like [Quercus suber]